jgi:hypothetical protein
VKRGLSCVNALERKRAQEAVQLRAVEGDGLGTASALRLARQSPPNLGGVARRAGVGPKPVNLQITRRLAISWW